MSNKRCVNEYNSLADIHLQAYFTNRNLLRHLRKAGLINKKREIVPEATYRANISRAEQKREVKEALAQAIVHKSLDLQLKRESEIQKRLEEIAKLELVKKIRSERLLRKTPSTPSSRSTSGQHPAWKYFTLYPNKQDDFPASRPRTAYRRQNIRDSTPNNVHDSVAWTFGGVPEKRQINLKTSVTSVETASCIDSCSESTTSLRDSELQIKHARGDANTRGHRRQTDKVPQKKCGPNLTKYDREKLKMSPYLYPVPITDKRALKEFDIPSEARKTYHPPESMARKRTNCLVTLQYLGTSSNISWEEPSPGTEVVIQQQHCGGNTLCVYRGKHNSQEEFSFVSHRHLNFPFSLSIYLAGILYLRVSACCEYRHRKGTRLGGPQGLFSLVNVQGASPCARCQLNRQMNEEKKKQKMKSDSKAPEDGQTKVESPESPPAETLSIQGNKEGNEKEDNEKNAENQEVLTEREEEAEHEPILFTVSGTVINVEESNSEEEDDYEKDFETEEEKEVKKNEEVGGETNDEEQEAEEVINVKDADDVSDETSSTESEEKVPSEEDEKVEGETDDIKEEEAQEAVKIKDVDDVRDETNSTKSEEKIPLEEGDDSEDEFHKDDEAEEKNKEATDAEIGANNLNRAVESSSLDKNGKEKDNESTSSEDSAEHVEEEKDKESVEDLKKEEKKPSTNSVPAQEKTPEVRRDESDIDGRSDSDSSKESSSSPPPSTSRRKSKMKPERRFRANNRKNVPSSSSESDSIAHLPADLEGSEKANNWIPASQQETI